MCTHTKTSTVKAPRIGSRLEDGAAHYQDHAAWSRRDFLAGLGASLVGACAIGGVPVKAFGQSSLLNALNQLETDRVLVLIQLGGGNDGLNTVIPYENDIYYQQRPTLAIPKAEAQTRPLGMDLGLHPSLDHFATYFGEGQLALLQNVGYPEPNLSHFRSTDIWLSASDSDTLVQSGWLGRHFDTEFPDFDENRPDFPLAVQIGGVSSLLFQGPTTNMGMSLVSADFFQRLVEEGVLYTLEGLPATPFGDEIEYVRSVANDSFIYASAVQDASETGINAVEYPLGNPLSDSLSIVARLIKGRLGARIYHVSLTGFDTHANQANAHANLLRFLAEATKAFIDDITESEQQDDVLVMTFSEFGRRVGQNGSFGTDHGTAAPLFLLGNSVKGGLYGTAPNLINLDPAGNMQHDIDFRTVYASVLQDWFGVDSSIVQNILLGHNYTSLGFIDPGDPVAVDTPEGPAAFELRQNYPNPFSDRTTITYTLSEAGAVRLEVFDIQGRRIKTLVDRTLPPGRHRVEFDASRLSSGAYVYRLENPAGVQTRNMTLVR